jgi:hypothetical protein
VTKPLNPGPFQYILIEHTCHGELQKHNSQCLAVISVYVIHMPQKNWIISCVLFNVSFCFIFLDFSKALHELFTVLESYLITGTIEPATLKRITTLLMAFSVNYTNFNKNIISFYSWWIFLPTMYIQILVFEEYWCLCPW